MIPLDDRVGPRASTPAPAPGRPRILYVLVSRGAGTGGHHISLRDLAARIRATADVRIVTVAYKPPPALEGVPDVHFVRHGAWRMGLTEAALWRHCREFRPTVIHSYDSYALIMVRPLSALLGIPLVHTQCGGPTARVHLPRAPDVVVFSEENLQGMSAQRRMSRCRLHHIASRVEDVSPDPSRVEALRAHLALSPDDFVILRINRFVAPYEPVMRQTLALAALMRAAGLPARAVLLGSANDPEVVARIAALADPRDVLVHAPAFTTCAAELLPVANAVVGTGRGLMEAASLGRPLFASVQDRKLPVPVDPETVEALFAANFSPRAVLTLDDAALADRAVVLLSSPERAAAAGAYARHLFETRFDVQAAVNRHLEIYAQAVPWPRWELPEAVVDLSATTAQELYVRARTPRAARPGVADP